MMTKVLRAARAVKIPLHVLIGMILYLVAYVNSPFLPGATTKDGWWGWWDQAMYLRSATALSKLDFSAEAHWYEPGYALAAAPFYHLFPRHPFLPLNMISVAILIWSLHAIFRRYLSSNASLGLIAAVLFLHGHILRNIIIPWNSIPTNAAICLAAYVLLFRRSGTSDIVIAATAAGIAFLCRPASAVAFAALFLARGLMLRKSAVRELATGISIAALFVVGLFGWHYFVYGSAITPYIQNEGQVGFSPTKLFAKLFFCFIDPSVVYGANRSFLNQFPWLVLSLPGIVCAFRREPLPTVGLLGAVGVSLCFYLSYNNFNPLGMFAYHSVHYILWIFPILALFSFLTIQSAWAVLPLRWYATLVLTPVIVILCVHPRLSLVATASNKTTFRATRPVDIVDIEDPARTGTPPVLALDGVRTHPSYRFYDFISSPPFARCYLHRPARAVLDEGMAGVAEVRFKRVEWEIWPRPTALSAFFRSVLWMPWKQESTP